MQEASLSDGVMPASVVTAFDGLVADIRRLTESEQALLNAAKFARTVLRKYALRDEPWLNEIAAEMLDQAIGVAERRQS